VNFRRVRLVYQLACLGLFGFLIWATARGLAARYPVRLFPQMSAFSGLLTIASQRTLAIGMLLGAAIAALTLFFGRFFCGWICPMGICQHAVFVLCRPEERKERYVRNSYHPRQKAKCVILILSVAGAFFGVVLAGYVDPLALTTRFTVTVAAPLANLFAHRGATQTLAFENTALTAAIFLGAVLIALRLPRFWCRTVCPLGALLSLFSLRPLFRMVRDEARCTDCGRCREVCQGACNIDKDFIPSECVLCMNCLDACPVGAIEYRLAPARSHPAAARARGVDLSRRHFLVSGILAAGLVACLRNWKNVIGRGFPLRIRPPGARPEEEFLARCLRCGACLAACPTGVLQPAGKETDLEGMWTPVLKMQYGYCEPQCTACSQVCPTGAIRAITVEEKLGQGYAKIGTATVDRNRCLPWAYGAPCLVCEEVCPVSPKAIRAETVSSAGAGAGPAVSGPRVDPRACIGCGACEHHCPAQDHPAIRVSSIGEFRSPDRQLVLQGL